MSFGNLTEPDKSLTHAFTLHRTSLSFHISADRRYAVQIAAYCFLYARVTFTITPYQSHQACTHVYSATRPDLYDIPCCYLIEPNKGICSVAHRPIVSYVYTFINTVTCYMLITAWHTQVMFTTTPYQSRQDRQAWYAKGDFCDTGDIEFHW